MRLAVVRDFRAEGWPSMDLCADAAVEHLPAADIAPRFRHVFGRLPHPAGFNVDRLVNRFAVLPLHLARVRGRHTHFHVADHSYAHAVHSLPAGRTGVYCHDLDAFRCLLEPAKDPRPRWFRMLARRVLTGMQKAAVVFHNSLDTRREILRFDLVPESKLVHAPLGVATEFSPAAADAPRLPWLDALAGSPVLLHVGSCIPRKRIDVLLDVAAAVRAQVPGVKLLKVGGEFTPAQRDQLARLNLEPILTHVRDLSRLELATCYRRADLVLVPSDAEGFGLPVIEALACGAAVLASDLPVLREVGDTAVSFAPVADVPAWAAAAIAALTNPAAAPPRNVRIARAAQFTWANHAAILRTAYERLA